jgi:hypothetical protein
MIDWVKNDPSVPAQAKAGTVVQELYENQWLKVCGDLANASKHFTLTTRRPITDEANTESGFGIGRFGMGEFGVGEESIEIKLNDGNTFNCLDLVQGVLSVWKSFFENYGV